jgi:zinc transport system substrate-binding protein
LYPLAQAIQQIGQNKVAVTDVVPPGQDPLTYRLDTAQVAEVRSAAVVIEVGGGFQPSLEAAAAKARRAVALDTALATTDRYVWLDPDLMRSAVAAISAALQQANPAAAAVYRNEAEAFSAAVASTGIDYQSTLSVCPRQTIVTADGAFLGLAHRYGLRDVVVGTYPRGPRVVAATVARVQAAGATTVFSEPYADDRVAHAVADAANLKVKTLDTLTGPPAGGWPRQANYISLMEANLGALSSALGCPDAAGGT